MIQDKNTTIAYHCPQCGMPVSSSVNIFAFSAENNLVKLKCPCGASELTISITKGKKIRLNIPCIVCPNSHTYTISPDLFFERGLFSFSCKFTALNICFTGKSQNVIDAIRKNEQELLEMFAEFNEDFDADNSELSDIFAWDDDEDFEDDEWDDEFYGAFNNLDAMGLDSLDAENGLNFELYENKNFDADTDGSLDLSFYSGFSTNKGQPFEMDLDDIIKTTKIKIQQYPIIMRILREVSQFIKDKKVTCKCRDFEGNIILLENRIRIECKKCGSTREIKSADIEDAEYIAEMDELVLDFDD